jgi:hypothetical protein
MRRISKYIVVGLIFTCSISSSAAPTDVEKASITEAATNTEKNINQETRPSYIICKNNNLVRTVRIEKTAHSCKTTYTKNGVDNVVGRSRTESLCSDVLDKIRENLESASWQCKDITKSRVSTSALEP